MQLTIYKLVILLDIICFVRTEFWRFYTYTFIIVFVVSCLHFIVVYCSNDPNNNFIKYFQFPEIINWRFISLCFYNCMAKLNVSLWLKDILKWEVLVLPLAKMLIGDQERFVCCTEGMIRIVPLWHFKWFLNGGCVLVMSSVAHIVKHDD